MTCLPTNTKGYIIIYSSWTIKGEVVLGEYSELQRIIQNYTEGYIIIYSP